MLPLSVSMGKGRGTVHPHRSVAKNVPLRGVSPSRAALRAERTMETMPVPVPEDTTSASRTLQTVGCTQPNSIKLQGSDKSVSLSRATTSGSFPDDGEFSSSVNHELNPIPLSQKFSPHVCRITRGNQSPYLGMFAKQKICVCATAKAHAIYALDLSLFRWAFVWLLGDSDWHRDDGEGCFSSQVDVSE